VKKTIYNSTGISAISTPSNPRKKRVEPKRRIQETVGRLEKNQQKASQTRLGDWPRKVTPTAVAFARLPSCRDDPANQCTDTLWQRHDVCGAISNTASDAGVFCRDVDIDNSPRDDEGRDLDTKERLRESMKS
jgi:hypothetical protein